jgi:DNA-binding winged helix-turn-helix (wHTH) protein
MLHVTGFSHGSHRLTVGLRLPFRLHGESCASTRSRSFASGPFEFYPQSRELFKNSQKLRLEGQPLQVLAILLDRPGMLISREEICKRLWPADTFVDSERIRLST